MNNNLEISIIVPFYNRLNLLEETILSVQSQTSSGWELIIVDDGSDDDYSHLIDKYSSEKITFIQRTNKSSRGASVCRNEGARSAKNELMLFLDSDDLLAPWCIDERIDFIKKNITKDYYLFTGVEFDTNNQSHHRLRCMHEIKKPLDSFLNFQSVWQTSCVVWKKSIFEKIGGWSVKAKSWQDGEIHIRLLLTSDNYAWGTQIPDLFIRKHEDSNRISNRFNTQKLKNLYSTYHFILNKIKDKTQKRLFNENILLSLFDWCEALPKAELNKYLEWIRTLHLDSKSKRKLVNYIKVRKYLYSNSVLFRIFLQFRKRLNIPVIEKGFWSVRPKLSQTDYDELCSIAEKQNFDLPFRLNDE